VVAQRCRPRPHRFATRWISTFFSIGGTE
jgi:hypothetical protein